MNRQRVKAISIAEALGLLDKPAERKYWVHPINEDRERSGQFKHFFEKIRCYPEKFFDYYRMSISSFDELLEILRPFITKTTTILRHPISVEERLTITCGVS